MAVRLVLIALLSAVAALGSAVGGEEPAADPPLFTAFKRFCIDTKKDFATVRTAVERAGGVSPRPSAATDEPWPMWAEFWEYSAQGRKFIISMGGYGPTANARMVERAMVSCKVRTFSNDDTSVEAARRWVGVSPSRASEGELSLYFYDFREQGSRHIALRSGESQAVEKAMADGSYRLLVILRSADGADLNLSRPAGADPRRDGAALGD